MRVAAMLPSRAQIYAIAWLSARAQRVRKARMLCDILLVQDDGGDMRAARQRLPRLFVMRLLLSDGGSAT